MINIVCLATLLLSQMVQQKNFTGPFKLHSSYSTSQKKLVFWWGDFNFEIILYITLSHILKTKLVDYNK